MRNRLILSLLSGLLMGMALPMQWGHWVPPNLGFLAWIALVPLIFAVDGLRPGRAYWVAFPGMLLAHTIMVYWFFTAVHVFGHLPTVVSILITFAGIAFLTAITSLAPMIVAWINRSQFHWWAWPLVWATIEFARNFDPFLQGFTFCNLIHSQYRYPLIIQIVNLVGPYWFLSLIVLVNVGIARARTHVRYLAMVGGVFALLLGYGAYSKIHIQSVSLDMPTLKVALIQGNIPQDDKWNAQLAVHNFRIYQQASIDVAAAKPDLIVWPEASYPWIFDLQTKEFPTDAGLPQVPILLGALTREGNFHHNSAVLFDGNTQYADVVHKYHLVPFGEYVPYKKFLFFAKKLTREVGDLRPATNIRPISLDGIPLGVLVCYEDTFPEIARKLVADGSTLLVNITNDAWYGWSSAAEQHLAASVFRAVENGRALVRATNTGVSAIIGADGELEFKSPLYSPAIIAAAVPLGIGQTPYNRWGWGVDLALPVLLTFALYVIRRQKTHP
ncbi:MAG: apolipoprotein N-acyltransferase [Deltaproteobacteria bacterium CG11_big_fil_rev_8_21_14_0_20_47_16]|nr:MAG: apolipoprotein N-acyltransferase [Deltaproteobacteria bacterium CG11_big_fil_rev_8_21_14_0_20_47_16]